MTSNFSFSPGYRASPHTDVERHHVAKQFSLYSKIYLPTLQELIRCVLRVVGKSFVDSSKTLVRAV